MNFPLSKRQVATSILLGLLGFFGAYGSWQFQFGAFKLSFVWSYVFPLMAALAYGPWGGIFSGIFGLGAFFPFTIWSTNGYASCIATILFIGWFTWHGFWAQQHSKRATWYSHPLFVQIPYAVIYGFATFFLYPIAFVHNPPIWQPTAIANIPPVVLSAIVAKSTPLMFLSVVMATTLLLLDPIRKILGLHPRSQAQRNTQILILSLSAAILFWLFYEVLVGTLIEGSFHLHPIWNPGSAYETLSLLVLIFFGFIVAVTVTWFSERQLQTTERLQQSEERLNLVLENVEAYIFIKDIKGRYTYVNRKVAELFQKSPEEIIGQDDRAFFNPQSLEEIQRSDLPVLHEGIKVERTERSVATSNASEKTFWSVKAPLRNSLGDIIGLCGISTDISEQESIAKERERLLSEIQNKNAELMQFTYTASHDLRTPLINIRGFLNELRTDLELGNMQDVERDLQFIDHSALRMGDLLKDLLKLIRTGKSDEPSEALDLDQLAHEVVALFAIAIETTHCEIKFVNKLPTAFVERNRIFQVFQNLIDNAIKYRQPTIPLLIEIGGEAKNATVLCWVKDNGIGIPKEFHQKIFGLFEKLDSKHEGTGIGLALVHQHIEKLGGKVWVESEGANLGTTIWLSIPRMKVEKQHLS